MIYIYIYKVVKNEVVHLCYHRSNTNVKYMWLEYYYLQSSRISWGIMNSEFVVSLLGGRYESLC